jgi:hypothetical protein
VIQHSAALNCSSLYYTTLSAEHAILYLTALYSTLLRCAILHYLTVDCTTAYLMFCSDVSTIADKTARVTVPSSVSIPHMDIVLLIDMKC